MSVFDGLGRALRWLRAKQDKRQYQLASEAGITKAMLSAYETGKQRPSLDTLEKVLEALGVGLAELHDAIEIVNERALPGRRSPAAALAWLDRRGYPGADRFDDPADDVYRILGVDRTLPPEEERAFREMLAGFHRFIRFLHHRTLPPSPYPPPPPSPPPTDSEPEG